MTVKELKDKLVGLPDEYDQPDVEGLQRAVCLFDFQTGRKW